MGYAMTWESAVAYALSFYLLRRVPTRDRHSFLWLLAGLGYLAAVGYVIARVAR